MNRIFVSSPAVACAAGCSADELWNSVASGNQSGIKKVRTISGEEFFAARIDSSRLHKSSARFDMRILQIEELALNQLAEKIEKAKSRYGASRIAVCAGSCDNGTELSIAAHRSYFSQGKFPSDYELEMQGADFPADFVSQKFGLNGISAAFSTACSSSAGALIKAAQILKCGAADAVVAGGADIASDTVLLGFHSLEAVSPQITNPFSKNRCGITLGEAASFFILTREPLDEDEPPVELLGYGESADAHHMTHPDPEGKGAELAIRNALKHASVSPEQISYINLHGTGTRLNDSMESIAVSKVFGEQTVPVSSTKPVTGHTLGAAGALGAAVCWTAISKNRGKQRCVLPVHVWDGAEDESLPRLNFISRTSDISDEIKICMSNSFAFGGANASIILGIR